MVSANHAVRRIGIPSRDLWEAILGRSVRLEFMDDNQSTIAVIKSGRNDTMRHVHRMHGVQPAWLHDAWIAGHFTMEWQPTEGQKADVFTKPFIDTLEWRRACDAICIRSSRDRIQSAGGYWDHGKLPIPERKNKKKGSETGMDE